MVPRPLNKCVLVLRPVREASSPPSGRTDHIPSGTPATRGILLIPPLAWSQAQTSTGTWYSLSQVTCNGLRF